MAEPTFRIVVSGGRCNSRAKPADQRIFNFIDDGIDRRHRCSSLKAVIMNIMLASGHGADAWIHAISARKDRYSLRSSSLRVVRHPSFIGGDVSGMSSESLARVVAAAFMRAGHFNHHDRESSLVLAFDRRLHRGRPRVGDLSRGSHARRNSEGSSITIRVDADPPSPVRDTLKQ